MSGTGWTRLITVVAGGATLVAVGGAAVGCSSNKDKEPAPSSTSSSAPAVSPTEKGVINMPPKAFNQNQNAADAMLALQSQGYLVQINNGGNYSGNSVLSACRITSVDGYKGANPPPSTTVFLTLSCPNSNN
ncbi:hypothetical protein MANY_28120 [Mycolicibacterium anyangense]|uniref:Uncharacterized protein n=1 Tax=Mycolicibacterium anyangense TaxID=1431246 RepID=A0A6N4W9P5_9MYCO|nr:hypothetical protein [Mycolicibacterium anyangense]BBZ77475.1 hypothetical protein MANY_28120 [Mycolicibacterium anyangense]